MWRVLLGQRRSVACRILHRVAATNLLPVALRPFQPAAVSREAKGFATRHGNHILWKRLPESAALLHGCDFKHWLVIMKPPPGDPACPDTPRDEIIQGYISTLAKVLESEDEAREKICSVSTKYYFSFGALLLEEISLQLKDVPSVLYVVPDSYVDVKTNDYGGNNVEVITPEETGGNLNSCKATNVEHSQGFPQAGYYDCCGKVVWDGEEPKEWTIEWVPSSSTRDK